MFERSLGAVGDVQRRRLLMALLERNRRADDEVALGDDSDADAVREQLRDELHRVHLPKLEDDGFVVWDREAGKITRGPRFEELRPLLRLLEDCADPTDGANRLRGRRNPF